MKRKNFVDIPMVVAIGLLSIVAMISLTRILTKPGGGIDFYSYWLPGHFVWQRMDPYAAALEKRIPQLPIYYLDGPIATDLTPLYEPMPANTAPVVLLLSLLSRVSWDKAFQIWKLINIGLVGVVAWSTVNLFGYKFLSRHGFIVLFILCSLIATRETLETGQTTLLTLACMMGAIILGSNRQSISGIFLGIALSKYSLTFPGALYFLYKRWYRGLVVSGVVQCIGILVIALIGRTTPITVVDEYVQIMLKHVELPGMHLSASLLASLGPYASAIQWFLTLGLVLTLLYWYYTHRPLDQDDGLAVPILLLIITMQWNLLIFYHRRYDHVAEILFLVVIMLWTSQRSDRFRLSIKERFALHGFAVLAATVWILPLYYLLGTSLYTKLFSLCSLIALVVLVCLLFRIAPGHTMRINSETE